MKRVIICDVFFFLFNSRHLSTQHCDKHNKILNIKIKYQACTIVKINIWFLQVVLYLLKALVSEDYSVLFGLLWSLARPKKNFLELNNLSEI